MTNKKTNPPDGMARAYLIESNEEPVVFDGNRWVGRQGLPRGPGTVMLKTLITEHEATPIHLLNPRELQSWAIAPERETRGFGSGPTTENWRLWVVTEKSSYSICRTDLENLASIKCVLAVYERRTIHGVDLLERVYLKCQPEQHIQGTASICRFIEDREPATPDDEPTELEDFELKILRECSGELPPSPWGAAVGQALETLRSRGLIRGHGLVTEKGREYLKRAEKPPKKLGRWRSSWATVDLDAMTQTILGGRPVPLEWDDKTVRFVANGKSVSWTRVPDDDDRPLGNDSCSCDDVGEGPCPAHGAAMAAQDRAIATRNATQKDADGGCVGDGCMHDPPKKLGRWRHNGGSIVDLDARTRTFPNGETRALTWDLGSIMDVASGQVPWWTRIPDDAEIECPNGCGLVPHRWRPYPEAGPHWRCSECGEPWIHPAPRCPECNDRKVTGMGPCSLCCAPAPKPEPPPAILRKLQKPKRLSLRLEALSPGREVAEVQCRKACEMTANLQPARSLFNSLGDLWVAIHLHYPRTRHLRAVRAAFTEYVKSQADVPKKPEGDAKERENER